MKSLKTQLTIAFVYLAAGLISGLFYREFTKINDFPEGQFTQLGVLHTHLLVLGFFFFLIVVCLEKAFALSSTGAVYRWFVVVYNLGVVLTAAMFVWHGSLTVLGKESTAMIAGIAGLGHIAITIGMLLFCTAVWRAVTRSGDSAAA